MSYLVNSPHDEESNYMAERITRETLLVQERSITQKEFPNVTAARLNDRDSVGQACYTSLRGQATVFKYPENSTYHNMIASTLNK